MGVHVLGPVYVGTGAALRPRDRHVLGVLVLRRDRVVASDEIADAVWHGDPPASWPKQVQICVASLRKALPTGAIETLDGGYRLRAGVVDVDADVFEDEVAHARQLVADDEPDRAATTYARALGLFDGEAFTGLDAWVPARAEAARLGELRRCAEEELVNARLAIGEHREVLPLAAALVREEPLREERWVALALAQVRCGRQGDALGSLRRARELLRDQLGIDPGPELTTLEEQILRQDRALYAIPARRAPSVECPYKGLARLEAGDLLFGRDVDIRRCLQRIRAGPLVVVAGPSGSGKSSLIRAGVVPELERDGRGCRVVEPSVGGHIPVPVAGEVPPILVVDQAEALFTTGQATAALRAELDGLAAYATQLAPVVLVIRADHLGDLALDPALGPLVRHGVHLLGPPTGRALWEAITRPAQESGLRLQDGLADLVVRDSEGEPGALPLMSHALVETWRRREGNVLTVDGYRASGGIRGAVARSAERLYDSLDADERQTLRSVLLRLAAPSLDGVPVRRRVPIRSLVGDAGRDEILTRLVAARLVTVEDEVVEVAHEALVRAWPRLRAWLEDDHTRQRTMTHLACTAAEWEARGRPDSELYRGARLHAAAEYRQSASEYLTPSERAFLDASAHLADDEALRLREQVCRTARQARGLKTLLGVLVVLTLIAAAATWMAVDQKRDAQAATRTAQLEALVDRSIALRATDRDDAALLAVEAARRWPGDPRATSALLSLFTGAPGYLGHRYVAGATSLLGAMVPGTTMAFAALDGRAPVLVDTATGQVVQRFAAPTPRGAAGRAVAVSADGRRAVHLLHADNCAQRSGPSRPCGVAVVYNLATGTPVGRPIVLPDGSGSVAINANGSLIAVGTTTGAISLAAVDRRHRGHLTPVGRTASRPGPGSPPVTFTSDGLLYAGSTAGPVRVIDPRTGRLIRTLPAPAHHANVALDVGRDGLLIAAGSRGLVALDTRTGARRWDTDMTAPDPCPWFAVSEATGHVYCGKDYGEIDELDRATGQRTGVVLDTQLGSVGNLDVTADGTELVAFGNEQPVITRWRTNGSGPVTMKITRRRPADGPSVAPVDHAHPVPRLGNRVGPASDGACVRSWVPEGSDVGYCGTAHGEVRVLNALTGHLMGPAIRLGGSITSLSATRGGAQIVVTAQTHGRTRTWVIDGATRQVLAGPVAGLDVTAVSLGGVVVGGTAAGRLTRYDLQTLRPLVDLPGAHGEITSIQFSNDGQTMLATSNDHTVSLYDLRTGTRLGDPIRTDVSPASASLSPDGRRLTIPVPGGYVRWDLDPTDLITAACQVAGRNLTRTEWATYLAAYGAYRSTCPGQPHLPDGSGT